jgi:hypothetical protein
MLLAKQEKHLSQVRFNIQSITRNVRSAWQEDH